MPFVEAVPRTSSEFMVANYGFLPIVFGSLFFYARRRKPPAA
jgi:hypothetical protein